MKQLIIGLFYDMKTKFLVFATKSFLFLLNFFGTHWNGSGNFDRPVTKLSFL